MWYTVMDIALRSIVYHGTDLGMAANAFAAGTCCGSGDTESKSKQQAKRRIKKFANNSKEAKDGQLRHSR